MNANFIIDFCRISDVNLSIFNSNNEVIKTLGQPLTNSDRQSIIMENTNTEYIFFIPPFHYGFFYPMKDKSYLIGWQSYYLYPNMHWSDSHFSGYTNPKEKMQILLRLINRYITGKEKKHFDFKFIGKFNIHEILDITHHNNFNLEMAIFENIRQGNSEDMVKIINKFFQSGTGGQLSKTSNARNIKNIIIAVITILTRAAILGGVPQEEAFNLSDKYILSLENRDFITPDSTHFTGLAISFANLVKHYKFEKNSPLVKRCIFFLEQNYRRKLTIQEISSTLNVSASLLNKNFKKETHKSIHRFIIDLRMEKAAFLLKYTDDSINDIAEYLGFKQLSHFSRSFKEYYHQTALAYRQTNCHISSL